MEKESKISLGRTIFNADVLDTKAQSVRVKKLLLTLKNVAQKECAL